MQFALERRYLGFDVALQSFRKRAEDIGANNAALVHRRQDIAIERFDDGDVLRFRAASNFIDGLVAEIAHFLFQQIEADAVFVAFEMTIESGARLVDCNAQLPRHASALASRNGKRLGPRWGVPLDDVNPVGCGVARDFGGERLGKRQTSAAGFAQNQQMFARL